jgi:hypothetical protein
MPRRILLPGLLLMATLTSALLYAQEPPPQPFPTSPGQPPTAPLPYSPASVQIIPDNPPLPQAEANNSPESDIVPVGLPLDGPGVDGDLIRAIARLHQEREALAREREDLERRVPKMDTGDAAELARLRQRLLALSKRLDQPVSAPPPVSSHPRPAVPVQTNEQPTKGPEVSPGQGGSHLTSDPYLQAQAYFRARQYQESLAALRSLPPESLNLDERLLVQYLSACCLRKLGKLDEAVTLYREVADAREDEFLAECSLWHLSNIGWRRDIEQQLVAIRATRLGH